MHGEQSQPERNGMPPFSGRDAFQVVRRANVDLSLFKVVRIYGEKFKIREAVPFRQGDFP